MKFKITSYLSSIELTLKTVREMLTEEKMETKYFMYLVSHLINLEYEIEDLKNLLEG